MTDIDELNREWTPGWHLDLEYDIPRILFSKRDNNGISVYYIYEYSDIDEHVKTCSLTNLEQLEARSFYRDHFIELLKKRMENRVSVTSETIVKQHVTARNTINTYHKSKRR